MKVIVDTLLDFQIAHKVSGVTVYAYAIMGTCFELLAPTLKEHRILKGCAGGSKQIVDRLLMTEKRGEGNALKHW